MYIILLLWCFFFPLVQFLLGLLVYIEISISAEIFTSIALGFPKLYTYKSEAQLLLLKNGPQQDIYDQKVQFKCKYYFSKFILPNLRKFELVTSSALCMHLAMINVISGISILNFLHPRKKLRVTSFFSTLSHASCAYLLSF